MTPDTLYHDVPPVAVADIYTASASCTILVVLATNNTGGSAAVTLQRVPSGGPAQSLLNSKAVPANDFVRLQGPIHLKAGDKLAARNHIASAITLMVSGLLAT